MTRSRRALNGSLIGALIICDGTAPVAEARGRSTVVVIDLIAGEGTSKLEGLGIGNAVLEVLSFFLDFEPSIAPLTEEWKRCAGQTACLAAQLEPQGAEFGLAIVVSAKVRPELVTVQWIDRSLPERELAEVFQVDVSSASLSTALGSAIRELIGKAGMSAGAKLLLRSIPPDVEWTLDGAPIDRRVEVRVDAGEHVLSASRSGFEDGFVRVRARPGQTSAVDLVLTEEQNLFSSPWFWLGAAAATLGLVVGGFLLVREPEYQLRQEPLRPGGS